MFVRNDSHRKPLQNPYYGFYAVLKAGKKTFTINMGTQEETVSIDRIKPAHHDIDQPVLVSQPPLRGRPRKQQSATQDVRDQSNDPDALFTYCPE